MKPVRTILLLYIFGAMAFAQQPSIQYTLSMAKPSSHLLEVELTFDYLFEQDSVMEFRLPVWRPGRYMVLDFASGIRDFSAVDAHGNPLRWSKVEKALWRVETNGATKMSIRYKVFANEFNQRTRGLNDEHAFIDGTAVFMYVEKYRQIPVRLIVRPYGNWHVTTGLDGELNKYTAPNYDYLVDCPLEIGNQKDFRFSIDAVPHMLSIVGEGNWESDTLIRDITKIVKTHREFWGEYPYRRYVFLIHCYPSAGGGTEHINSTIMGTSPFVFKNPDTYRRFLGLVSHEYFHTWNVKQLRPAGIHPYDYTKENYSRELWIAEGTTSYYGDLLLVRAGFKSADKYLEGLATTIRDDRQRPGNLVQPLTEASFDAWVKYWRATEQSYNMETDYYGKGATVSLLLDLEIRRRSNNAASLDDVMRTLYKRFPLSGPGYTLDDFQNVANEITGADLQQFFTDYVFGTKPLPWENILSAAGLQVGLKDSTPHAWLGFVPTDIGERTRVTRVLAGSPAYEAGMDVGDEILALNGFRVRTSDLNDRLTTMKPGETVTLTVFRNDRLRDFKVTAGVLPLPTYTVTPVTTPDDLQKRILENWLKTSWPSSGAAANANR